MITSPLSVAGQFVIRDGDTNSISVIGVLEEITAAGFPLLLPHVTFVASFRREAQDVSEISGTFTTELSGDRLNTLMVQLNFQNGLAARTIVNISPLVIARPGQLVFAVQLAEHDEPVARYTINVLGTIAARQ